MKPFVQKIIQKHFPFLGDSLAILKPDDVEIREAGADLLDLVGWRNSYHWSGGEFLEYQFFSVFDGEKLRDVPYAGVYNDGSGCYNEWSGLSIGEFCFETGLRPEFVIELTRTETDSSGDGPAVLKMTIYKLVGVDWEKYFNEKLNHAEQELGLG